MRRLGTAAAPATRSNDRWAGFDEAGSYPPTVVVCMTLNGEVKWKTGEEPPFSKGGTVLADGLLLATDGNTKLYLIGPDPAASSPLPSAGLLEPGNGARVTFDPIGGPFLQALAEASSLHRRMKRRSPAGCSTDRSRHTNGGTPRLRSLRVLCVSRWSSRRDDRPD
jgi:hypothetical protein